jgi:HlyD family secretion protein
VRRAVALALVVGVAGAVAGCGGEEPDAFGNFEATEVTVSAEIGGSLLRFIAQEGNRLPAGAVVGQIDTTSLSLEREELRSSRGAAGLRATEAEAQIGVLRTQLATAEEEYARTSRLYRAEAATARQLNEAEGAVRELRARIEAARAGTGVAREETGGAEARIARLGEEIRKGTIVNPSSGTVLSTFVEAGEFVQRGQPLYRIADLDTLTLRVYVSGSQLSGLRLGERVTVRIDSAGGGERKMPGVLEWISSQAEFTPTPIQTRDERATQVYAVKIRVPNPAGTAKIGMPADVEFTREPGSR